MDDEEEVSYLLSLVEPAFAQSGCADFQSFCAGFLQGMIYTARKFGLNTEAK